MPASNSRTTSSSGSQANGHEPVDCGPHIYDAQDDYPPFCLRAAERTAADPGSLGIVIGGSGNGEQIAANKVQGRPRRARLERADRRPRPRAQQRQRAQHRRPHAHRGRGDQVRRDLPGHPVLAARSATAPHRHAHRVRDHRRAAARSRRTTRGRTDRAMPEGHTIHRLAAGPPRAVRRPAGAGGQPAGQVLRRRRAARRRGAGRAPRRTASTSSSASAATGWVHVHLGLYRQVRLRRRPRAAARRPRSGCGWPAPSTTRTCAGPTACELITDAEKRRYTTGSAPTRCARRRPASAPGAGSRAARIDAWPRC